MQSVGSEMDKRKRYRSHSSDGIKKELLKGVSSTDDRVCDSDSELSDNECIFESDSEDDLPLAGLV